MIVGISGKRGESLRRRFFDKVEYVDGSDCWYWMGAVNEHGYGVIGLGPRGAGLIKAHRLSWLIHRGPIPDGALVCHSCDNPQCVNSNHLFLGSQKDNMRDCANKGRTVIPHVQGETVGNHKLDEDQVLHIRLLAAKGYSQRHIAAMFGVTHTNVGYVVRRKTWSHI